MTCEFCTAKISFVALKNDYSHYRCTQCHHISVLPAPSAQQLDDYYNKAYFYTKTLSRTLDKRHYFIANHFGNLLENLVALDIGCAQGDFLDGLRDLGVIQLHGIELSKNLANAARTKGYQVSDGMFNSKSFQGMQFQIINLGDVLEHVSDPRILLTDIAKLLAPNGILTLATPNIDNFFSNSTFMLYKIFNIPWSSLDPPAHISLFTYKSLKFLLNDLCLESISSWSTRVTLTYELGHTHLFRSFREQRSPISFLRWVIGWPIYFMLYSLNVFSVFFTKKDTGMVHVIMKIGKK